MGKILKARLTSNAAAVAAKLAAFPEKMGAAIAEKMDLENQFTVGHIMAAKLSLRGPTTLGVVTNRLRGSGRANRATVSGTMVESAIGSNVGYAGVHEYGFTGSVAVQAYQRKAPQADRFTVGGKMVSRATAERFGLFDSRGRLRRRAGVAQAASGIAQVKAHTRRMHFPARAMFRTGIEERLPEYGEAMSAAIVAAYEGLS